MSNSSYVLSASTSCISSEVQRDSGSRPHSDGEGKKDLSQKVNQPQFQFPPVTQLEAQQEATGQVDQSKANADGRLNVNEMVGSSLPASIPQLGAMTQQLNANAQLVIIPNHGLGIQDPAVGEPKPVPNSLPVKNAGPHRALGNYLDEYEEHDPTIPYGLKEWRQGPQYVQGINIDGVTNPELKRAIQEDLTLQTGQAAEEKPVTPTADPDDNTLIEESTVKKAPGRPRGQARQPGLSKTPRMDALFNAPRTRSGTAKLGAARLEFSTSTDETEGEESNDLEPYRKCRIQICLHAQQHNAERAQLQNRLNEQADLIVRRQKQQDAQGETIVEYQRQVNVLKDANTSLAQEVRGKAKEVENLNNHIKTWSENWTELTKKNKRSEEEAKRQAARNVGLSADMNRIIWEKQELQRKLEEARNQITENLDWSGEMNQYKIWKKARDEEIRLLQQQVENYKAEGDVFQSRLKVMRERYESLEKASADTIQLNMEAMETYEYVCGERNAYPPRSQAQLLENRRPVQQVPTLNNGVSQQIQNPRLQVQNYPTQQLAPSSQMQLSQIVQGMNQQSQEEEQQERQEREQSVVLLEQEQEELPRPPRPKVAYQGQGQISQIKTGTEYVAPNGKTFVQKPKNVAPQMSLEISQWPHLTMEIPIYTGATCPKAWIRDVYRFQLWARKTEEQMMETIGQYLKKDAYYWYRFEFLPSYEMYAFPVMQETFFKELEQKFQSQIRVNNEFYGQMNMLSANQPRGQSMEPKMVNLKVKLENFSGQEVEQWETKAKFCMKVNKTSEEEMKEKILSTHMEGQAKVWVMDVLIPKYERLGTKLDLTTLFRELQREFGKPQKISTWYAGQEARQCMVLPNNRFPAQGPNYQQAGPSNAGYRNPAPPNQNYGNPSPQFQNYQNQGTSGQFPNQQNGNGNQQPPPNRNLTTDDFRSFTSELAAALNSSRQSRGYDQQGRITMDNPDISKIQVKLDNFNGSEEVDGWIQKARYCMKANRFAEDVLLERVIPSHLKGEASEWFMNTLVPTYETLSPPLDLETFFAELKERFDKDTKDQAIDMLANRRINMHVEDPSRFLEEIQSWCKKANITEETEMVEKMKKCLNNMTMLNMTINNTKPRTVADLTRLVRSYWKGEWQEALKNKSDALHMSWQPSWMVGPKKATEQQRTIKPEFQRRPQVNQVQMEETQEDQEEEQEEEETEYGEVNEDTLLYDATGLPVCQITFNDPPAIMSPNEAMQNPGQQQSVPRYYVAQGAYTGRGKNRGNYQNTSSGQTQDMSKRGCFRCKKIGHIKAECPQPPTAQELAKSGQRNQGGQPQENKAPERDLSIREQLYVIEGVQICETCLQPGHTTRMNKCAPGTAKIERIRWSPPPEILNFYASPRGMEILKEYKNSSPKNGQQ